MQENLIRMVLIGLVCGLCVWLFGFLLKAIGIKTFQPLPTAKNKLPRGLVVAFGIILVLIILPVIYQVGCDAECKAQFESWLGERDTKVPEVIEQKQ